MGEIESQDYTKAEQQQSMRYESAPYARIEGHSRCILFPIRTQKLP